MSFVLVVYGSDLDNRIPLYYGPFETPDAAFDYAAKEGLKGWDVQSLQRP